MSEEIKDSTPVEIKFENVPINMDAIRDYIKNAENMLLEVEEKIEIEVKHHFSKDVYAREMIVPKGTVLVGKTHKYQNLNILSKGEVSIISQDGVVRVSAPFSFVATPGAKRLFLAHEDSVWTVIHGTDSKDVNEIEKIFIIEDYTQLEQELKEVNVCHG